ncbi:hypothetical protein IG631_16214 [Alternaria alternata]|nr:hypothetical protein IG631_16214 [Alternaria alternata]
MLGPLMASQTEANHAEPDHGTPRQARDFLSRQSAWHWRYHAAISATESLSSFLTYRFSSLTSFASCHRR